MIDIVRILFMVPLYAVISTASYFWWVSIAVLASMYPLYIQLSS